MDTAKLLAELAANPSAETLAAARNLMPDEDAQRRLGIRRVRAIGAAGKFTGVADWTDRPGTVFHATTAEAAMLGAVIKAVSTVTTR